jgi:hypothetical protein
MNSRIPRGAPQGSYVVLSQLMRAGPSLEKTDILRSAEKVDPVITSAVGVSLLLLSTSLTASIEEDGVR